MMDFDCKLFMILCIMVNQWAMTTAEFWQSSNYYGMDISTRGSQRRPAELRRHRHRHQHDDGLSMLSNGVEIEDISTGRSKLHEKNVSRKGQRQKNDKNALRHLVNLENQNAAGGALWPQVFNIAPRAKLHVNATCGQHTREEYCKTINAHPNRERKPHCSFCDAHNADPERRHPIENVVDGTKSWWQSPTLHEGPEYEYVTIMLDLKQIYQVMYVSMRSAITPRPASWILERSVDGINYQPWQYFGINEKDCVNRYEISAHNEQHTLQTDTEIICSTKFGKAIPLENGEMHLSLLKNRPGSNTSSIELLDFMLARYIRIRLQGMHTTLQSSENNVQWLVDRTELNKRSFYSLRSIKIGARLECNGHASEEKNHNNDDMVECECEHNTCGINCEKCCAMFNQQPYMVGTLKQSNACEKCQCNGHATECYYNPEVELRGLSIDMTGKRSGGGVCINCSDFTTGYNCEKCIENYYRPNGVQADDSKPCIPCDCNAIGSDGPCASDGGVCKCKEGYSGPKCSECATGYAGDKCEKCACNSMGTMPGGECETHCQCKLHVEGQFCDKCIPGYFGLSAKNPEGCMKCYCSGIGDSCESSNILSNSYETLKQWLVTDISKSVTVIPSPDNETGYLVFGMYELPDTQSVYWLAPENYVGNILKSYGSSLVYNPSWVIVRGDTSGKPTLSPTLILIGRNGMKIAYGDRTFTGSNATIKIPLMEKDWYHVPRTIKDIVTRLRRTEYRGDPVTRIQFMSVLSDVDSMLLRGTFHTDQVESVLERAVLHADHSLNATNEYEINLVEQCQCPPGYGGLSCEVCDFGYVRIYENSTTHERLGKCIPCPCHGHAATCNLQSNECGECLHNTFGDRCEQCTVGYYGNAMYGTKTDCQKCACPLFVDSNNFSPKCQMKDVGFAVNDILTGPGQYDNRTMDYICTECPEGFAGDHCERCDIGYFGDPTEIGSTCKRCACNGGSCDPLTGRCIICPGNTQGLRCEQCKAGYWGEPLDGCEKCNCQHQESESDVCDSKTGQCKCKERYTGHHCDECKFGYANISLGCEACNCNQNGSTQNYCDTHTGQCACKMGVEGLRCDNCQDEYYNLTSDGCAECRCNPFGSIKRTCNRNTGMCLCRDNVIGRACDRCADGFWNIESGIGCQACSCHTTGSRDGNCSTYTGQCNCKPGVGGLKCDQCMDGFYGLSNHGCKPCDECTNSAYNCDPDTGRCICPPLSKGIDCQQCYPNSWGWEHKIGCKLCNCDRPGSIGQSCDLYSGQCLCREGFIGIGCDSCAPGYYGYPNCQRCNCNPHGSIYSMDNGTALCNENGQCVCKPLVTGVKCDQCMDSTFGLSKTNANGCTSCFCFGRSKHCEQSDYTWGQIRIPMARNVTVEYMPQDYVVVVRTENSQIIRENAAIEILNDLHVIPSSLGNVSIGTPKGFDVPLYFQLPTQFLGDHISSYSGHIQYTIQTQGCQTVLHATHLKNFPLVQIHSHAQLIIDYFESDTQEALSNASYFIELKEGNWRNHFTREIISRSIFMSALQNIKHIFLRGTSWMDFTQVIMANATMDTGIYLSGSVNNLALGVENCKCPKAYSGSSCQDPANGYYRWTSITITETEEYAYEQYIGQSLPCNCSGRSEICNKKTGYCESCSGHTGGRNCEQCAEGFYGDPFSMEGCQPCPCPETSKNFAKGCTFSSNRVRCICKLGYTGDLCERCSLGFYGTPDNSDGRCMECDCEPDGIVSGECDEITGQCNCKPGITGRRCDKCEQAKNILKNGHCKVCDNCTLTLLERTDELERMLIDEANYIDLDGIPAPWPRLLNFENTTIFLEQRLNDYYLAHEQLEDFNDSIFDKLHHKATNEEKRLKKLLHEMKKYHTSAKLKTKAETFLTEIRAAEAETQNTVLLLNQYGTHDHHINLHLALGEAQQLLNDINTITSRGENAKKSLHCANDLLNFWSSMSKLTTNQVVEASEMKYYGINTKDRINNVVQLSHHTFNNLAKAETTLAYHRRRYDTLLFNYKRIFGLKSAINDVYNTSIIPQTDITFEFINDNYGRIEQDLENIHQLRKIVDDINDECEQNLAYIRSNYLKAADNHSRILMRRAKDYAGLFQHTKDGAVFALLASSAHKNISNAITTARISARETEEAVAKSKSKLYSVDGESVIGKSIHSLRKSQQIREDSINELNKIQELEDTLKIHQKKVDSIKNTIWQTGLKNNNISSTLNALSKSDGTMKIIDNIGETAEKISDQMREVRREAVNINGDVYKLKLKLTALEPQWDSKLGFAEENVSQSLSNIRSVNKTLNNLESISAKNEVNFQMWNQTLSSQLQELREKIAKARHVAEGIRVSMESKNRCIRSYIPPAVGLTTSNTIVLSIALSSSTATSPLLFIEGENRTFIAIELVRRKIRFVWNLGGNTAAIAHPLEIKTRDPKYDDAWYYIEANRTMNLGSLIVRQMGHNGTFLRSSTASSASTSEFTRFLVESTHRVWIGGVPADLRPRDLQAHEVGLGVLLNQITLDDKPLGLWHFAHSEGECMGAMLGAHETSNTVNERHFNGIGYAVVTKARSRPYRKKFFALQMSFKSLDENALLFLAVDAKNNRSVSLTLHDGKIVFRIDYGGDITLEINTTKRYNTGSWISVEAAREFTSKGTENGNLKVNNEEPRTGSPTTPIIASLLPDLSSAVYYIGGVPPGFKSGTTKAPGADHAYLGCMRDIQINGETYDPLESSLQFGVASSCKNSITNAGFFGNGYMELNPHSLRKRANFGFVFQTLQLNCLLLLSAYPPQVIADDYDDNKDLRSNYSVSLHNGKLHIWLDAGRGQIELTSNRTLNDGEYHVVSVTKTGRKIELRIDDEYQMTKSFSIQPFVVNMAEESGGLYIGGAPSYAEFENLAPSLDGFTGSIKDLVFNNRTISFTDVINFTRVNIGRPGPAMGYHGHYNDVLMKTEPIGKSFITPPEGCHRVGIFSYEANAFKFGDGPNSHSVVKIPTRQLWQKSFNIQFDFRTFYPNGVLFIAPGTKEKPKHFIGLVLRNGQLNLIVRGRKKEELNIPRKLNDGQWHHVELSRVNKMLNIKVYIENDRNNMVEDNIKLPRRTNAANLIYIGGISENSLTLPNELLSKLEEFKGCIRHFKVNNTTQDLARPGRHFNVGQCFPKVEKGSYFPGDAYAIYKRVFHVGKYLELEFEFRTSELNGVLISISEPNGFPALAIELHNGKIVMSCDLGDGNPFRVESNLGSKFALCDNRWHNISAMYDSEQIAIRIDNQPSVITLGPHHMSAKVHTKSPLYIGGLPETAPSGILLSRENYKGCIRNVVIRNEIRDWTDMDELQNVLLSECLAIS